MRPSSHKTGALALSLATLALLVLTFAVAAPVALGASPILWAPADSTYGVSSTSFIAVGSPAPAGTGMTQPPTGVAFGCGFWTPDTEVFSFGFVTPEYTGPGMPTLDQTDLMGTVLSPATPLSLVFTKAAGRRIDSVAIVGDPDAQVSLDYAGASLTEATQFTVRATVTDPVASASGNAAAAFGLVIDCATASAHNYYGSLFVTDMHWFDVQPPTFTSAGMAGLSAHGTNGVMATLDGIFAPEFLTTMGISDPNAVQGYVDATAVTGWSGAAFYALGQGDGSLWPTGYWKYRITNSTWSRHNLMFGRQTAPARAVGVSPKGKISRRRPTFAWRKVASSAGYEVRVYKGSKLLLKKTACTAISWRASKALPRKVALTWKVRAVNGAGAGAWSAALRFKIR